jgi:4a-hydroxytetrahydrobiopterin dehydratase
MIFVCMKTPRPAPLTELQIAHALIPLAGWRYEAESLVKEFVFADFRQALAWMLRAGFEAEELDHHPEWTNVYRTVTVSLRTHDADNRVTALDVELATRLEKIGV